MITRHTHITYHQGESGIWTRRWFCQLDSCAPNGKWSAVNFGVWLSGFGSLDSLIYALNNRGDPTQIPSRGSTLLCS